MGAKLERAQPLDLSPAVPVQPRFRAKTVSVTVRLAEACNLGCSYCYPRTAAVPVRSDRLMTRELAATISAQFCALDVERVEFGWNGGEPTLCAPDVLRAALDAQAVAHGRGIRVTNKVQTNGVRLPDPWMELLLQHPIEVGVSMDGPPHIHDRQRPLAGGGASSGLVLKNVRRLRAAGIPVGCIMVVTEALAAEPGAVLDFIVREGLAVDFLPAFRRAPAGGPDDTTVLPASYARFLTEFFDLWVQHRDPPVCRSMEDLMAGAFGLTPSTCTTRRDCSMFYSVGPAGDVYACDLLYGTGSLHLGNLREHSAEYLLSSNVAAGVRAYMDELPASCLSCEYLARCGGGCRAQQSMQSDGEVRYHFCSSRKLAFSHVDEFRIAHAELTEGVNRVLQS